MIEKNDLQMIEAIVQKENTKLKEQMINHTEAKISESEERMKAHVDEKISESEERMKAHMEKSITDSEKRMKSYVKSHVRTEIRKSENVLLEEMERTQENLERRIGARIDRLERKVDELAQYSAIRKLEADNTATLLKLYVNLEKRVSRLEHA